MANKFNVGDKYYRIVKHKPYVEFKVDKTRGWTGCNLVLVEYKITKECDHYYEGVSDIGLDKIVKIPIMPTRVIDYMICEDCVDYDTNSMNDGDLYNCVDNLIFTDRDKAVEVFNRVLKYKICTLEDFKNEHGINCNYPF